jgi:hypothetical protein
MPTKRKKKEPAFLITYYKPPRRGKSTALITEFPSCKTITLKSGLEVWDNLLGKEMQSHPYYDKKSAKYRDAKRKRI